MIVLLAFIWILVLPDRFVFPMTITLLYFWNRLRN